MIVSIFQINLAHTPFKPYTDVSSEYIDVETKFYQTTDGLPYWSSTDFTGRIPETREKSIEAACKKHCAEKSKDFMKAAIYPSISYGIYCTCGKYQQCVAEHTWCGIDAPAEYKALPCCGEKAAGWKCQSPTGKGHSGEDDDYESGFRCSGGQSQARW